ncbi:MAG TPA: hypothetical protein VM684_02180, partial [Gaiellales bacterium]|nr:hypothetical protein [Gaiellales bacterium]
MTAAEESIDRRQIAFRRWQPYGLLLIGTVLSAATVDLIMPTADRRATAAALVVAALVLQVWWGDRTSHG